MRCNVPFKTQHGRQHAGLLTAKKAKVSEAKPRKYIIPDELILEIRAKYEYEHMRIKDIATLYNLDYSTVNRYVNYQAAGHLIPVEPEKQ